MATVENESTDPRVADWQPRKGKSYRLSDHDPRAKPFSNGSKAADRAALQELATEIDTWQDLFHADRRYRMLVVLQGLDTAGKDGTIRAVFKETSPLGVRSVGWKSPSEEERAHDYLWRIHQQVPRSGEFVLFNRSHYEDVLVPVVEGWIDEPETQRRYAQINDFERMLGETGTVIMKFMLHISHEEQRQRLQERLNDPSKRWKFDMNDLKVRSQWNQYQQAYEALLSATSTDWAPWTIVPADSKTHRNLMIATLVRDRLKSLDLRHPPDAPELQGLTVA